MKATLAEVRAMTVQTRYRRTSVQLLVALTTLSVVAPAHAGRTDRGPNTSAVDAYVETVPSASGVGQYVEAVPTGTGDPAGGPSSPSKDPAVAAALATIVESSRYGAPASKEPASSSTPPGTANEPKLTTSFEGSFRSAIGALGTSSDARLVSLLLVVVATTVAAIVLSARRGSR